VAKSIYRQNAAQYRPLAETSQRSVLLQFESECGSAGRRLLSWLSPYRTLYQDWPKGSLN
jgi:hypothetical protein